MDFGIGVGSMNLNDNTQEMDNVNTSNLGGGMNRDARNYNSHSHISRPVSNNLLIGVNNA